MLLFSQTRIIIVEDQEMFRTVLARYCQTWGFSVVGTCSNGRDAILQSVRLKPDLILLDLDLPVCSGFDVAVAVRQKLPKVRIVVISSGLSEATVAKALKIGVNGILSKCDDTFDCIGQVIPKILAGDTYFSSSTRRWIPAEDSGKRVAKGTL